MALIKELILIERKNDWALKVKVTSNVSGGVSNTRIFATFAKWPASLIIMQAAVTAAQKAYECDKVVMITDRAGLETLRSVGIYDDSLAV